MIDLFLIARAPEATCLHQMVPSLVVWENRVNKVRPRRSSTSRPQFHHVCRLARVAAFLLILANDRSSGWMVP